MGPGACQHCDCELAGDGVGAGEGDGHAYLLRTSDGSIYWKYKTDNKIEAGAKELAEELQGSTVLTNNTPQTNTAHLDSMSVPRRAGFLSQVQGKSWVFEGTS